MRFKKFINELSSEYGAGITFYDIDQTIFDTKALIFVINDKTKKIVKKLTNQEFNTYKLKKGFSFDFSEFEDAELFYKTSIPIKPVVDRIKRMFKNIEIRNSRVVFLTARSDFLKKEIFLQKFREHGIPIDNIYVERAGNIKTGTTSQKKENIILKYLSTGLYRRVRLIDDSLENLKGFLSLKKKIPQNIINKVKKNYGINKEESIKPIEFYALQVLANGSLKRIE